MKKILKPLHGQAQAVLRKCLILFTMLLIVGLSARAQVFTVGELRYRVISATDRIGEVYKYVGEPVNVVIPETVENNGVTYSVKYIEAFAFNQCKSLTSVTIPNSVKTIGEGAFYECTSLTTVTIPKTVTKIYMAPFEECTSLEEILVDADNANYCSDNGILYNRDMTTLIQCPGARKEVVIPNSVTTIMDGAFSCCKYLTSVSIPSSVTIIRGNAFSYCTSLASVTIPNSVISIGWEAFYECTSLASVTIPNSVTSIEVRAFEGCTSLASVSIPNSVTSIEKSAFSNCESLASVTIPNSVTSIGECAFSKCESMASLTIPNSVTSIGVCAFEYCRSLKTIYSEATTPPQAEKDAFYGVPEDAVVYVPEGTIGAYSVANEWKRFFNFREKTSGVSELAVEHKAGPVDVYNMQGMLVKANASQADVDALAPGLYIIGGRKVLVK